MNNYTASAWEPGMDQNGRPCWVNRQNGTVTYQLQDTNGLPLNYGMGMWTGMPTAGAHPMAMPGMGGMAPLCPPTGHTVAIVGDRVKVDKWSEYCDETTGKKYYHNPAKPTETTWEKPEDFDEQKNAGKPAPPSTKPKPKKKGKYDSDRRGWL